MKLWITNTWDKLRDSFWFLPTVMVAAAVVLSLVMIQIDKASPQRTWITTLGWTFSRGPEGSRAVLSAVASSMMTIASVTFSITIVALQLASSQFGPRLLRNFMRDRGNQIAIGTFISTFTYCLLVLRTVNGTENQQFVPHLSVTVGLLLALISVGVLIYFVHHSAESIQAENVIAEVSNELQQAADRLYPRHLGNDPPPESAASGPTDLPNGFERECVLVSCPQSDYLQAVDVDKLMRIAVEKDLILSVDTRPGKFCFEGDVLVRAWPPQSIDDDLKSKIRDAFYFGRRRTLSQDVEFAIDQLVEIAVRALSPGINDPNTAINCVDRLGAALCMFAGRTFPSSHRYDDGRHLRVVANVSTISGIVEAAFDQIRQAARSNVSVTIRLLETIHAVARQTQDADFIAALRRQAETIHHASEEGLKDPCDRKVADQRFHDALKALAKDRDRSDA